VSSILITRSKNKKVKYKRGKKSNVEGKICKK
jgi:hypothetical protein